MTSLAKSRCACAARRRPDSSGIARLGDLRERGGEPGEPVHPELHRLDQRLLLVDERAGRLEVLRPREDLLLLVAQALEVSAQVLELDPGRRQLRVEGLAERGGVGDDAVHVVDVALVLGLLLVGAAAVDDEDEDDGEDDRARDEDAEPVEARSARRGRRPCRQAAAPPRPVLRGAGLLRRRLVEEVELDVALRLGFLAVEHGPRGSKKWPSLPPGPDFAGLSCARAKWPARWSLRSPSASAISSSVAIALSAPSEAVAPARCGWRATRRPAATSRSRSSPGRGRPARAPSGRWTPPRASDTRAACARSRSRATSGTSTWPTPTSPGARCGRRSAAGGSTTGARSRPRRRSSRAWPTRTRTASCTAT